YSVARLSIVLNLCQFRPMRPPVKKIRTPEECRAAELFDQQFRDNGCRTDRMFAVLMVLQWIGAVVLALSLSPRGWDGTQSHVHPHVWLSLILGGVLA